MEPVPERIGVAGDWHGNMAWATRAVRKISALLPADGPRIIVHLGDFGIWPGPGGREYLSRLDAALTAAGAVLSFVDGNHEDFAQLARLRPGPDGRAQVTERIWHLPRGHRWRWHGRDWLALGGAVSLDRAVRTAGADWWPEEEITLAAGWIGHRGRARRRDGHARMPGRHRARVPARAAGVVAG